jgi:imidazoleglycerol-phosphate dehydratase/histidinol-phosphatase
MKKALFIDRDGTVILEPPDKQIDSLEKLRFYPGVICALTRIARETEFELVMVTNQDGLGTQSFPEHTFWPAHNKMLDVLAGEGVDFAEVLIDPSMPDENADTRKPGLGMMGRYLNGDYDLANSFVIGDRETDLLFARNLGAQAIMVTDHEYPDAALCTPDWDRVYRFLVTRRRVVVVTRQTSETRVRVRLNLDGTGKYRIDTGLGFFDHMLAQLARHGGMDLEIAVQGDLHVDEHHTIEDTAIVLGQAISQALGQRKGITRYGFVLPMDEAGAKVAVDISGRGYLVWDAEFHREFVGDMPTEMFPHFFRSLALAAGMNIHVHVKGENEHHKIEAAFKALARALRQAAAIDGSGDVPSTKGVI